MRGIASLVRLWFPCYIPTFIFFDFSPGLAGLAPTHRRFCRIIVGPRSHEGAPAEESISSPAAGLHMLYIRTL